MVARSVDHELLEADLDDLERRIRVRDQIAAGKQLDVDSVAAGRHLRRQRDGGAEQRRREKRHGVRLFAVQAAFAHQPDQRGAERIVAHLADIVVDQFGQRRIGDAELQPPLVLGVGDGIERTARQNGEVGGRIDKGVRAVFTQMPSTRCLRRVRSDSRGPVTVATIS